MRTTLTALFGLLCLAIMPPTARAAPADPHDRSNVPVEQQPTDSSAAKIVLIAGDADPGTNSGDHEHFAGCAVFYRMLKQTPGVAPVVVQGGWPNDPAATFAGAKAVVFFMNGGGKQTTVPHAAEVDKLAAAGVGIVHLHQCIDYPADVVPTAVRWLGGAYHPKTAARGHWDATYGTFPEHPITRGVAPFTIINEGYIFKLTFVDGMKGVTPLLRARNLKAKEGFYVNPTDDVWCFAYDRPDGGRSFVNTGGHAHANWGQEGFRRLTTNGILWAAKVEIPANGSKVDLDQADLMQNLDKKAPKKPATRPAVKAAKK